MHVDGACRRSVTTAACARYGRATARASCYFDPCCPAPRRPAKHVRLDLFPPGGSFASSIPCRPPLGQGYLSLRPPSDPGAHPDQRVEAIRPIAGGAAMGSAVERAVTAKPAPRAIHSRAGRALHLPHVDRLVRLAPRSPRRPSIAPAPRVRVTRAPNLDLRRFSKYKHRRFEQAFYFVCNPGAIGPRIIVRCDMDLSPWQLPSPPRGTRPGPPEGLRLRWPGLA
jgi:hypothetical protein